MSQSALIGSPSDFAAASIDHVEELNARMQQYKEHEEYERAKREAHLRRQARRKAAEQDAAVPLTKGVPSVNGGTTVESDTAAASRFLDPRELLEMAEDNRLMDERVEVLIRELHVWRMRLDTSAVRCRSSIAATEAMLRSEVAQCRLQVATACDAADFDIVSAIKRLANYVAELKGLSLGGIEGRKLWGEKIPEVPEEGFNQEQRPAPVPLGPRESLITPSGIPPLQRHSQPDAHAVDSSNSSTGGASAASYGQADGEYHDSTAQGSMPQLAQHHQQRERNGAQRAPPPPQQQQQASQELRGHDQHGNFAAQLPEQASRNLLPHPVSHQEMRHVRQDRNEAGSPHRSPARTLEDISSAQAPSTTSRGSFSFTKPAQPSHGRSNSSPATTRKSSFAGFSLPEGGSVPRSPDSWKTPGRSNLGGSDYKRRSDTSSSSSSTVVAAQLRGCDESL